MNRSKAGARLSAYLEGDLSESERSSLENELADDPTLRETLRELEDVVSVLQSLPEPELPPAFATRVMAQVQEQAEAPRGVRAWIQRIFEPVVAVPLAAGITALALVIGAAQPGSVRPDEGGVLVQVAEAEPAAVADVAQAPIAPELDRLELVVVNPPLTRGGLTEAQRNTLDANFSRLESQLNGLHPHAPSFASQIRQTEDPGLQIVSFERRRPRARRR